MNKSELLKIHEKNRNKLFKERDNLGTPQILYLRSKKIFDDLILEGFIRYEIRLMLKGLLECCLDNEEN